MALRVGGYGLLRDIMRGHVKRILTDRNIEPTFAPIDMDQYRAIKDDYQNEIMPRALTTDPKDLTPGEKDWVRERFYALVNMPLAAMQRWSKDPRILDATYRGLPYETHLFRKHLRELMSLKRGGRPNGRGWTDRGYRTAQASIFVIHHLFRRNRVQYFSWVALQNFGCDWQRSWRGFYFRKLPAKVQAKAAQRLAVLRKKKLTESPVF